MLTAFSLSSASLGVLSQFVYSYIPESKKLDLLTLVISWFFLSLASLFSAVLAQWRFSYGVFPNIRKLFENLNKDVKAKEFSSKAQFNNKWVGPLVKIHVTSKKNNDKRVQWIIASMILFMSAIIYFFLSVVTVLLVPVISLIVIVALVIIVIPIDVGLWFRFTDSIRNQKINKGETFE